MAFEDPVEGEMSSPAPDLPVLVQRSGPWWTCPGEAGASGPAWGPGGVPVAPSDCVTGGGGHGAWVGSTPDATHQTTASGGPGKRSSSETNYHVKIPVVPTCTSRHEGLRDAEFVPEGLSYRSGTSE